MEDSVTKVLVDYGVLGIAALMLIVVVRGAMKYLLDRNARLETKLDEANVQLSKHIFVLEEANVLMAEVTKINKEAVLAMRDMQSQLHFEHRRRDSR